MPAIRHTHKTATHPIELRTLPVREREGLGLPIDGAGISVGGDANRTRQSASVEHLASAIANKPEGDVPLVKRFLD